MKIKFIRKSFFTGEYFEDIEEYLAHLVSIRTENRKKWRKKHRLNKFNTWLTKEKEKLMSVQEIEEWFDRNQEFLMRAYNNLSSDATWEGKFQPKTDRFNLTIVATTTAAVKVSNSHSCPVNGVTNWGRRHADKPTGYPGYTIRTQGLYTKEKPHRGGNISSLFEFINIHLGTGGCSGSNLNYYGEIFLADWPGLERTEVSQRLKNANP